jgi:hypothetical protein
LFSFFLFFLISTTLRPEKEISISELYCPGMSPDKNILKLATNAFVQRIWTMQKNKIFMENYLPTETPATQRAQMETVQLMGQDKTKPAASINHQIHE